VSKYLGDDKSHDIDTLKLRCKDCLTDLSYIARHKHVPCLPEKMFERNRRRLAVQEYNEREKDARVRAYGQLLKLARECVDTMNAKYGVGKWKWPTT
jgi:hypothetical protein